MRKLAIYFCITILTFSAYASTDGELVWTRLSFCNGAGYCVDANSNNGSGISLLRVSHNGVELKIPTSAFAIRDVDAPLFNEVRLLSVQGKDGTFGNVLEIPYLRLSNDGKSFRNVLKINFDAQDSFVPLGKL